MKPVHVVPRVTVRLGGADLFEADATALHTVVVRGALSEPTRCELSFVGPTPGLFDGGVRVGDALELRVAGQDPALFEGEVTSVERVYRPSEARGLVVRAHDRLQRLQKRHTVRAHVQVTAGDLAHELLASEGITVDAQADGPLWRHLLHQWPDDLALLQDVAARSGLYFTLRGSTLRLCTLEGLDDPLPLALGDTLLDARVRLDGDRACRSIHAFGWDVAAAVDHDGVASAARSGRDALAVADPTAAGGTGLRTLTDTVAPGAAHAEGAAQAELDRATADEVVFTGTALGDTRLQPGARVTIEGLGHEDSGQYVLTATEHRLDGARGYLTTLSTAAPGRRPPVHGPPLVAGLVSTVDDPDGLGRVRVTLPGLGGVESDWLQVLSPGGAGGRGLVLVPDVGDRVAVLLAGGHLAGGVVLGGLHGEAGVPESGVSGGRVRRWSLRTGGGHLFRLDDEARVIRLEDPTGSYLELGPEGVKLHAAVPLTVEAPGQPVVVAGNTVDFRRQ